MTTIADKSVLVTGGNRGIGRALVAEALRRGATRVYVGTRKPVADSDARITPVPLDVTDAAQIQQAVVDVGTLDVLVNNAGIALYDDLSDRATLERHLAVNLFGTYSVIQAFLPLLSSFQGRRRQQPVGERPCSLAADPGLLDLEGRGVLADAVAAHSVGRAGRHCSRRPDRHRGYRHDKGPRRAEGFAGVRRASRSSTEWRTTKRTSFPIRCRDRWRRAGAAVRPRHSSGSTRRSRWPNASRRRRTRVKPSLPQPATALRRRDRAWVPPSRGP